MLDQIHSEILGKSVRAPASEIVLVAEKAKCAIPKLFSHLFHTDTLGVLRPVAGVLLPDKVESGGAAFLVADAVLANHGGRLVGRRGGTTAAGQHCSNKPIYSLYSRVGPNI